MNNVICIGLLFFFSFATKVCAAPLFDNIGALNYPIETSSSMAQRYFNQGLTLFYSFEYGEAIRSFRAALETDPKCAMCAWGLGLALSSKNGAIMTGREREEAGHFMKLAYGLANANNKKEARYILALQERRSSKVYKKRHHFSFNCGGKGSITLNEIYNYANAMRQLVKDFPNDVNAKVLYAAAMMDVAGWDFWTNDGKPQGVTIELIKLLEDTLMLDKDNIGANHYYLHVLEQSPNPEKALESAKRFKALSPGLEQLAHAPAHLYYALGDYSDATISNQHAIDAQNQYRLACEKQGVQPESNFLYYHNLHSLVASASMEGNSALAIHSASTLVDSIPERSAHLQGFIPVYILTLARFGEWETILSIPNPNPQLQYALGLWYYAQGLACFYTDNIEKASQYLGGLKAIAAQGGIPKNFGQDGAYQLSIASEVLAGLLADKNNKPEEMMAHFTTAVTTQDKMLEKQPPTWYFPTRELLGFALLKLKKPEEAKLVFEYELKKHRNNPWGLYGLSLSFTAMGNKEAAKRYQEQLRGVWTNKTHMPMSLI